tara:strand:+ start:3241 stop:3750 length:510 start_codon:yes stop_codon:yes gene_type:complete
MVLALNMLLNWVSSATYLKHHLTPKRMNKAIAIITYIILIFLLVLLSFDFYLSEKYYTPSGGMFMSDPEKYADMKLTFVGPVINISDSSFYMSVNHKPLKVYYPKLEQPKLGQVLVVGQSHINETTTASEIHYFNYNYLKYYISFIAIFPFLYIFFRDWKIKRWRFVNA